MNLDKVAQDINATSIEVEILISTQRKIYMPHFYMHLRYAGELCEDLEGGDFENLNSARAEADACACGIMSGRGQVAGDTSFEITDESGEILLVCPFHQAAEAGSPV